MRVPWLFALPLAIAVVTATYLFGLVGAPVSPGAVFLVLAAAAFGAVGVQIGKAIVAALTATPSEQTIQVATDRRRRELEREKGLILKAIKELEFDHQMGKISDADYTEAHATYRARAVRVMQQLDAGAGSYREIIERELEERITSKGEAARPVAAVPAPAPAPAPVPVPASEAAPARAPEPVPAECACGVRNDPDAVFCKKCGTRLRAEASP